MIRLVLADDHALVRAGLRALVESMGDTQVVAEASNGSEAIKAACAHLPDVILMDISMPELNGIEALASIKRRSPRCRVIIVSMHDDSDFVVRAFHSGADGYVLKNSAPKELRLAIEAVMRGEAYASPLVSRGLLAAARADGARGSPLDRLSPRQRQILQLIAEGRSTKAIAHRLGISIKTVETHRAALKERLAIADVAGMVLFAFRHGLVEGRDREDLDGAREHVIV